MAQPTSSLHRFQGTFIQHSEASTPAGDALQSLRLVLDGEHALECDANWGWLGRIRSQGDLD